MKSKKGRRVMKYIIFLGDGMADEAIESLGGKTPLMVADTPNMDAIAARGVCGRLTTVPDGMPASSTVANLSILGYDPRECFEGRGVLEASAMGVELDESDCALRLNLINVDGGLIKSHSSDNITSQEAAELIDSLNASLHFDGAEIFPGVSYRHVLKLTNNPSKMVDCKPPHDHLDQPMADNLPKPISPEGEATATLLNSLIAESNGVLENHPVNLKRAERGLMKANFCWPWAIGKKPKMATFTDRFDITGAMISAVDLIRGIGIYAGFEPIYVEGATGLYDTNYEGKADAVIKALESKDFVFVHVEASDEAAHEGNLDLKIKTIEYFDRRLVGRVIEGIDVAEVTVAVLPDHYTPISIRTHSPDPVPFAIAGPNHPPDAVEKFDEMSCSDGKYHVISGEQFIRLFLGRD